MVTVPRILSPTKGSLTPDLPVPQTGFHKDPHHHSRHYISYDPYLTFVNTCEHFL